MCYIYTGQIHLRKKKRLKQTNPCLQWSQRYFTFFLSLFVSWSGGRGVIYDSRSLFGRPTFDNVSIANIVHNMLHFRRCHILYAWTYILPSLLWVHPLITELKAKFIQSYMDNSCPISHDKKNIPEEIEFSEGSGN